MVGGGSVGKLEREVENVFWVVCRLIVLEGMKRLKGLAAYEELAKGFAALAGTAVWEAT